MTGEDGTTTSTYTVTVMRATAVPALPLGGALLLGVLAGVSWRPPAAADPTPVLRRHSVDFGARVDEAPDAAALRDPRGDLRVDRSRRRGEGAHVDPAHPGHEGAVQRSRRRGRPRAWPAAGRAERTNLTTAVTVLDWGAARESTKPNHPVFLAASLDGVAR